MNSELPVVKARISQLLAMRQGVARINNLCTLVYVTQDVLGYSCDRLTVIFNHISGIPDGRGYDIKSRTTSGIITEIQTATASYLLDVADRVIGDLAADISSC